ncbi:hypothetical protein F4808DRAFT_457525 [Astrocystis sublimbata]|nr:hypothetical protein F4808DRAFT_457525 [Astrocystis sublimbata]
MSHPNTGTPSIYEDGIQHNYSHEAIHNEQRHHLHKDHNRGMDELLLEDTRTQIEERYKTDPLYPATMHGNRPSRGAQQDAEIQAEEAEMLRKKQEKANRASNKEH